MHSCQQLALKAPTLTSSNNTSLIQHIIYRSFATFTRQESHFFPPLSDIEVRTALLLWNQNMTVLWKRLSMYVIAHVFYFWNTCRLSPTVILF